MIEVECSHCGGTGRAKLSRPLAETLSHVPDAWTYTKDIFKAHRPRYVKTCAINNRLRELEAISLIQCQARGRKLFWKRLR